MVAALEMPILAHPPGAINHFMCVSEYPIKVAPMMGLLLPAIDRTDYACASGVSPFWRSCNWVACLKNLIAVNSPVGTPYIRLLRVRVREIKHLVSNTS